MRRSRWAILAVAVISTALISPAIRAEESENIVRFGGGWYATTGDANDLSDNGLGLWGSYEHRFFEKLGVELMLAYVDYDSFLDILGGISMTPATATLNFHRNAGGKVDVYVGPTLGFARLEIGEGFFGTGDESSETEFAWGAAVGVDVPFGQGPWAFSGSLRYLTADFDGSDFSNVVFHLGAGYRF
jgi:hypothetical protein